MLFVLCFSRILDTDDFWEKDKLELQIPLFKDLDVGVVYGNLYVVNEKLNRKKINSHKMYTIPFMINHSYIAREPVYLYLVPNLHKNQFGHF